MIELGKITLPPTPKPSKNLDEFQQAVTVWTRQCEQTIRQLERFVRAVQAVAQAVPTGGTAGQKLTKNSNANYDVSWV